MRRVSVLAALLTVVLGGALVIGWAPFTEAEESTPAASMTGHPLVGTWVVTNPDGAPVVIAFTADGVVVDTEGDGGTGVGAWQPTGERTAAFTFVLPASDQEFIGIIGLRATAEVDASGATFTAPYSVSSQLPDGTAPLSDQGQVTGTRLPIEPVEAAGASLAGFPTWTVEEPGTPEAGTPTT
jgi:hypothetical protein